MKNLHNKLERHLTKEEYEAIVECVNLLEDAFGRNVHSLTVNAEDECDTEPYGLALFFEREDFENEN